MHLHHLNQNRSIKPNFCGCVNQFLFVEAQTKTTTPLRIDSHPNVLPTLTNNQSYEDLQTRFDNLYSKYVALERILNYTNLDKYRKLFTQLTTQQHQTLQSKEFTLESFENAISADIVEFINKRVQNNFASLKVAIGDIIAEKRQLLTQQKQAYNNVQQALQNSGMPREVVEQSIALLFGPITTTQKEIGEWHTVLHQLA